MSDSLRQPPTGPSSEPSSDRATVSDGAAAFVDGHRLGLRQLTAAVAAALGDHPGAVVAVAVRTAADAAAVARWADGAPDAIQNAVHLASLETDRGHVVLVRNGPAGAARGLGARRPDV